MPTETAVTRRAVILAGGKGSRLGPYTTVLPKPLLPVGERAILDVVVHQLRDCGFGDITLAVGYLAHLVRAVMGDGSRHGVRIGYSEETEPLGTVGPLAEIDDLDDTFLVMNGDVLTALDYGHLVDVHRDTGNVLTIASHRRVVRTEYGVLHFSNQNGNMLNVSGFEEKLRLLAEGRQVGSYLYDGYWLDIGRHEDYEKALIEFEQLRPMFLPEREPQTGTAK